MYRNLDKAKKACNNLSNDKTNSEKEFHVIHANQTMNPNYSNLSDDNYMICSGTYIKELQDYWEAKNETLPVDQKVTLDILHTSTRNAQN